MKPKSSKAFIFYIIATTVLFLFLNTIRDLVTKNIAYFSADANPIFQIVYAENSGAAFSMFENFAKYFGYIGILAVLFMLFYVHQKILFENKIMIIISVLFTAGVLGNTVERLTLGYVIDYIKLSFINFPVFNLFDVMITISIILYILYVLFGEDFFRRIRKKIW